MTLKELFVNQINIDAKILLLKLHYFFSLSILFFEKQSSMNQSLDHNPRDEPEPKKAEKKKNKSSKNVKIVDDIGKNAKGKLISKQKLAWPVHSWKALWNWPESYSLCT